MINTKEQINKIEQLNIANKSMADYIDEFREKHKKMIKKHEDEIEQRCRDCDDIEKEAIENAKKKIEKINKNVEMKLRKQRKIIDNLRIERKNWKHDWFAFERGKKEIRKLKEKLEEIKKKLDTEEKLSKHLIKLYNKARNK